MSVFNLASTVIDKIFPDKTEAQKAKLRLKELEQSGELAKMAALQKWDEAQTSVNAVEAAHRSLFVAGWRPGVGWVGVTGMALAWVVFPILEVVLKINGVAVEMPAVNVYELGVIIGGMLGLGGLRTYEKYKGVTK